MIAELTAAAISDANKSDPEKDLGSVDFADTPPTHDETQEYGTQAIIKRLLAPLGFEFVESIETACWDSHEQDETLIEVRLRHAGIIGVKKDPLGDFLVSTDSGVIEVCSDSGAWKCIPEKEGDSTLTGDNFELLTTLIHQRGQSKLMP